MSSQRSTQKLSLLKQVLADIALLRNRPVALMVVTLIGEAVLAIVGVPLSAAASVAITGGLTLAGTLAAYVEKYVAAKKPSSAK